jgi:putative transcriptional regulator
VENREEILKELRDALKAAGFSITEKLPANSSIFDIIAKRDEMILVAKVLLNIDSFRYENSVEMGFLAKALDALPVLVGERCTACTLEGGVVYVRHTIPAMNRQTFIDYVKEGVLPLVYAAPGGLYARIDGYTLKKLREEKGVSLSTLAEIAGVSRKAVTLYESDIMGASVDVVSRIEDFLDTPLTLPVDPRELFSRFECEMSSSKKLLTSIENDFFSILKEFGYETSFFKRAPVDAIVQREEKILSEFEGSGLEEKVRVLSEVTEVVEKEGAIFARRIKKDSLKGIAIISSDELKENADDLLSLIEKKKKR